MSDEVTADMRPNAIDVQLNVNCKMRLKESLFGAHFSSGFCAERFFVFGFSAERFFVFGFCAERFFEAIDSMMTSDGENDDTNDCGCVISSGLIRG